MQGRCSADSGVVLVSWGELKLSVPAVKGCHAGLHYVFTLTDMDLAGSKIISRMFISLKRHVHQKRLSHPNGTCLWFLGASPFHLTSHLSCPQISV